MSERDMEKKQWFAESRKLNTNCGCEQRGNRLFNCSYHEGADDAWDAAYQAGLKHAGDALVAQTPPQPIEDVTHDDYDCSCQRASGVAQTSQPQPEKQD